MKKIAALLMVFLLVVCVIQERTAIADPSSSYGIYGTVTYPGGVVAGATVTISKYQSGSYVYHGTTTASACGYYTYDTGGTGTYRAYVSGYYPLRYSACGSIFDNEQVAGSNTGAVSIFNPQVQVDVGTN